MEGRYVPIDEIESIPEGEWISAAWGNPPSEYGKALKRGDSWWIKLSENNPFKSSMSCSKPSQLWQAPEE